MSFGGFVVERRGCVCVCERESERGALERL